MLFDTHVHTFVSPDSDMRPETAIDRLRKRGIGVIFTEHVDFVVGPDGRPFGAVNGKAGEAPCFSPEALDQATVAQQFPYQYADFIADLKAYPRTYLPLQCDSVLLGMEIGLTPDFAEKNRQTAANGVLDFIIGSVHYVDGWDITGPYFMAARQDYYQRYLTYTCEMIAQNDFFQVLGHMDYVARYTPLPVKEVYYWDYPAAYDAIFQALCDTGKLLEFNTSRLGQPEAEANLYTLFQRYHALGGRYVTLGSDAHTPARLAYGFDKALRMLHEIGLQPVYFQARCMRLC